MARKPRPALRSRRHNGPRPAGVSPRGAGKAQDEPGEYALESGPGRKRQIEQYSHPDKQRANNPPVGLVTPETDREIGRKAYQYDPHLDPALQWAGKAERLSFEVPTVSLHVHERIDPKTIIQAVRRRNGPQQAPSLFDTLEEPDEPLRDALDFYKHPHGWSNRLIAGDSLVVMNSLLEKEGLGGKVQMIYMDPPYGIKYGSNFQPFVNKRDVKDGKDEDLTQEPEMIRAFRDTWELGIHSYLSYLRDRLLLARELLTESGSIFVQISDENVHHVKELMDELFGARAFCAFITFRKKMMPLGSDVAEGVSDYILWYARDRERVKTRPLFRAKETQGDSSWSWLETTHGERRRITRDEIHNHTLLPSRARLFQAISLLPAQFRPNQAFDFILEGKTYQPPKANCWKTDRHGMDALAIAGRLIPSGITLRYVLFHDDYPMMRITNLWAETSGADDQTYVVQTNIKVIQRCILMTTDPGDLVFDPTCGSGTTAYVAEQWGRRWITCDTSRVAVTLAKQRLMTAVFDYYELKHPKEGVGSGFLYKTVPHITLKSIANNPDIRPGMSREQIDAAIKRHAETETLYDQPFVDNKKVRVTGPFTVEAVPAPVVRPITELVREERLADLGRAPSPPLPGMEDPAGRNVLGLTADITVARSGATLRHTEWRDELLRCGVRGKGGQKIQFSRVEPLGGCRWLHADGETLAPAANEGRRGELARGEAASHRVVISYGPEHALLEQKQVELAWQEARQLNPRPAMLLFCAFQFDPEAAKDIDELTPAKTGMTFLKVQMNTDLLTEDLKKKRASNESYWLIGQPDVEVRKAEPHHGGTETQRKDRRGSSVSPRLRGEELYEVEVRGFDYYNPRTGQVESGGTEKIAMWLLDTDYDGRSLFPRQVFFPLAGEKEGWARLARNLRAEIDEGLIEAYRGTVSLPFAPGEHRCVAVKIVDDRGIESLKVVGIA